MFVSVCHSTFVSFTLFAFNAYAIHLSLSLSHTLTTPLPHTYTYSPFLYPPPSYFLSLMSTCFKHFCDVHVKYNNKRLTWKTLIFSNIFSMCLNSTSQNMKAELKVSVFYHTMHVTDWHQINDWWVRIIQNRDKLRRWGQIKSMYGHFKYSFDILQHLSSK